MHSPAVASLRATGLVGLATAELEPNLSSVIGRLAHAPGSRADFRCALLHLALGF